MFKRMVKCPLGGGGVTVTVLFLFRLHVAMFTSVAPTGCSSVAVGKMAVGQLITIYPITFTDTQHWFLSGAS